jgi:hypothetical protein
MSKDLILEQIQRRARLDHNGDFEKAAEAHFRDHPGWYAERLSESRGITRRDKEERDAVNSEVQFRMEMIACRDKLDLDKPADRAAAAAKVCTEDPDLYKRYRAANTVRAATR